MHTQFLPITDSNNQPVWLVKNVAEGKFLCKRENTIICLKDVLMRKIREDCPLKGTLSNV